MYIIADLQIPGRYFAEGVTFKTKRDVIEQLADFHDVDFTGTDDKDNELSIKECFKFWKINTIKKQLDFILCYGEWAIEKVGK